MNYLVEIPGVFASFCRDLLQGPKLFQKDVNFVFLAHFAVRSFHYLVEIPGVFASFCCDLLQAPRLLQKDANFVFLAHFAVRSFELLGRNTRCVCQLLPGFVESAEVIPKGCDL